MERFTIETPADVLSFIGHTLGFWPHESLVCVTLVDNHVGATLRVDLPKPGAEISHARTIAEYLAHDGHAVGVIFALYTSMPAESGQARPHAATIAALTGSLAEQGMSIRDGLLVGDDTVSPYDSDPPGKPSLPLTSMQASQINAEFVYRGSTIAPTNRIALPASTEDFQTADAVESCAKSMQKLGVRDATDRARALWKEMLEAKSFPTDERIIRLIASLQFPTIRDQLMADIPGIDEPMDRVLLAQTNSKPHWARVEWAEQLLLHAYTRSSTPHSAPILTAIAFISWWEGRGSKAHQYLQLALEADPDYRLARLGDQVIGRGTVAGWTMDRNTAYRNRGLGAS
ncbi:DUF4192 domain-containing protein [Arthrobacter zhaoguopingii]|uniref:DUF4192 domain-containing protein n=1 Tax=Arthrobacter zhaoguopingii TaxID=2681491 RepID=UPI001359892C|nr:DUF4192 domain-containing protein [Arthrobacter zhaoguopingii]